MTFHVPTVDIASFVTSVDPVRRESTARALDDACRDVGFVQIVGHGVPASTTDGLAGAMDDFFALDPSDKLGYRAVEGNRGYTPPKAESLSLSAGVAPTSRMKDFFEAFNVGSTAEDYHDASLPAEYYAPNVWPTGVAGFESRVRGYFLEAKRVAHVLTDVFAAALRLPDDFFAPYLDRSIEVLRMNNYALPPGEVEPGADLTGMGEHTDFGIVTVLWADRVAGLQVLGHDGAWHDVLPAPGALLVNLGDLMARWTNDYWVSTLHRVKPPIVDGRIQRRRSAAFFLDGNSDATISGLPGVGVGVGVKAPSEAIRVDAHIAAKLRGSRQGILNPGAGREAERIRAAAS